MTLILLPRLKRLIEESKVDTVVLSDFEWTLFQVEVSRVYPSYQADRVEQGRAQVTICGARVMKGELLGPE